MFLKTVQKDVKCSKMFSKDFPGFRFKMAANHPLKRLGKTECLHKFTILGVLEYSNNVIREFIAWIVTKTYCWRYGKTVKTVL